MPCVCWLPVGPKDVRHCKQANTKSNGFGAGSLGSLQGPHSGQAAVDAADPPAIAAATAQADPVSAGHQSSQLSRNRQHCGKKRKLTQEQPQQQMQQQLKDPPLPPPRPPFQRGYRLPKHQEVQLRNLHATMEGMAACASREDTNNLFSKLRAGVKLF